MVNSHVKEKLMSKYDFWLRLQLILLNIGKKEILLPKLHAKNVLSKWSEQLHKQMQENKVEVLKHISPEYQYIFNGRAVFSKLFSLELCQQLLYAFKIYTDKHPLKEGDISQSAHLKKLVKFQKNLWKPEKLKMDKKMLEKDLASLSHIFNGLGYPHFSFDFSNKSFKCIEAEATINEVFILESLKNAASVKAKSCMTDRNEYKDFVHDCWKEMERVAESAEKQKKENINCNNQINNNWTNEKLTIYAYDEAGSPTKRLAQDNLDDTDTAAENYIQGNVGSAASNAEIDEKLIVNQDISESRKSSSGENTGKEDASPNNTEKQKESTERGNAVPYVMCPSASRNYEMCGKNVQLENESVQLPDVQSEEPYDPEVESENMKLKTVQDLDFTIIDKLAKNLDKANPENYSFVGLAQSLGINEDKITYLKLCHTGGGFPANHFLKNLKTTRGSYPVDDLLEIVEGEGEKDVSFDENLPKLLKPFSGKTVQDIPHEVTWRIAIKLTQSEVGSKCRDWKFLASELDYSTATIELISSTKKENGQYSPTSELFHILTNERPDLKILDLSKHFEKMENIKAKNDLEAFLNKKANKIRRKKDKMAQ